MRKVFKNCKNIEYVTADFKGENVTIRMDITNIPLDNNYFDVIICNHVLEHIEDDKKALMELYRILKPGGIAILQVPISFIMKQTFEDPTITTPEQREKEFGQHDHVRIYGMDYPEKIQSVGFDVETYSFREDKGVKRAKKFGVLEDEKLFIGKKPF